MIYTICVNAAGCLPDSDTYPYNVDGLDAALDAIENEFSEGGIDPERYTEELDAMAREVLSGGESLSIALDGTYRLTIEPAQCQYSAGHRLRGEDTPAVTLIECGPLGKVPACQACAEFYSKLSGDYDA